MEVSAREIAANCNQLHMIKKNPKKPSHTFDLTTANGARSYFASMDDEDYEASQVVSWGAYWLNKVTGEIQPWGAMITTGIWPSQIKTY